MSMRYAIDAEADLITVTVTGTVGIAEVIDAFEQRVKEPDYRPGMNILMDARQGTFDFSAGDMARLVDYFDRRREERGAGFRFAMVSAVDVTFGLGRMYAAHADLLPEHIEVFRDLEQARRWVRAMRPHPSPRN